MQPLCRVELELKISIYELFKFNLIQSNIIKMKVKLLKSIFNMNEFDLIFAYVGLDEFVRFIF